MKGQVRWHHGKGQRSMATHTGRSPMLARWPALNTCTGSASNRMAFLSSPHPDNVFPKEGLVTDARITNTLNNQLMRVWRGEVSARVALEEADRIITALFAEAESAR